MTTDETVQEYTRGFAHGVHQRSGGINAPCPARWEPWVRGYHDGEAAYDSALRAELDRLGVAATPRFPRPSRAGV